MRNIVWNHLQGGVNSSTGQRHTTTQSYFPNTGFADTTHYPNNDTYRYSQYDAEGNPTTFIDAQGIVHHYVRSLVDSRLEAIQYNDRGNTGNISIDYDGFNRVKKLTRFPNDVSRQITVEYSYDDNDLVTEVRTTYPNLAPQVVRYSYYPDGSRATMDVAGQVFIYDYTYTTDTLRVSNLPVAGLRIRVRLPLSTSFNLDSLYDRRGLLRLERTSGQVYREYHYNGRGLLTALYNRNALFPATQRYADFTNLLYDSAGNLGQMTVDIPAFGGAPALAGIVYYTYDTQDRLLQESFVLSGGSTLYSVAFGWDANDNLTQARGVTFASNAADQIANTGWVYQNGDLVQMTRFSESGIQLTYNREHQLIRYYNPNAQPPIEIRYFYRPDGLLGGRVAPNYARWYLYDGDVPVAEIDATTGAVVLLYVYSPDGLTQRFAPGGSNRRLYTFDPLGSVVHRLSDANYPNVLSVAWHDSLGATYLDQSSTGVNPFPTPDVLDGYLARYGLFRDPLTRPWNQANLSGLIVASWGVMFDPATGKFASRSGESQNPYARLFRPERNFADANWNLVVSFAVWGYNSGDPNADPGVTFLSGLDSIERLLVVGGEWASYASPIGGGGSASRAVAREAAEATAKQAARRASKEAGEKLPVVIGEDMERVRAYARRYGYQTISDFVSDKAWNEAKQSAGLEGMLALNRRWIEQMMREGRQVIDIGPDFPSRRAGHPYRPSVFYELERRMLKGYSRYIKVFSRWKGNRGGVIGFDEEF